jgi:hypothetical protein
MTTAVEMMEYLRSNPVCEDMGSEEATRHYLGIVEQEYGKLSAEDKQRFADFVYVLNTQRYNFKGDLQAILKQMPLYQLEIIAQRFKNYGAHAQA